MYIYEHKQWPNFKWENKDLIPLLGKVRNEQGRLIGQMESLGFELQNEASLETLTIEVVKSTEIEGEILNPDQVRSSIARRLGMDMPGLVSSDREVDGVVDMMLDATRNFNQKLTKERLFDWHYSLFPTGRKGMQKITVGDWRTDSSGPMQVISGVIGKEKVHFEAPSARVLGGEMERFIDWFNNADEMDLVFKSAIAHLWFITIHPFEDGNGRIARAISDMLLAKSDGINQRFYSMSSQIRNERKAYYQILERSQKGTLDITNWLNWYLKCLLNAIKNSSQLLSRTINKHKFWLNFASIIHNQRQVRILNKLLDGFEGNLTSSKWAKIANCSQDTALRDIQDLVYKRILQKTNKGGRSTNYELVDLDQ